MKFSYVSPKLRLIVLSRTESPLDTYSRVNGTIYLTFCYFPLYWIPSYTCISCEPSIVLQPETCEVMKKKPRCETNNHAGA